MALRAGQAGVQEAIAAVNRPTGRRHKFNASPTVVDGIWFASKKEAKRWSELRLLQAAGQVSVIQRQSSYPLVVHGCFIAHYVSDFTYMRADGEIVIEDVKGVLTPIYKLKKKLMKALYGIQIQEV